MPIPSRLALCALLLPLGCQPAGPPEQPPEVDCDEVSVPAYEDLGIWNSCTGCHASDLTGPYRRGAPEGVDFDTYDAAVALAEDAAIEVNIGNMPFTGTVSEDDKEDFYAWALCGTP